MKKVLFGAMLMFVATLATEQAIAKQVCIDMAEPDTMYTEAIAAADKIYAEKITAASEAYAAEVAEADTLLEGLRQKRAEFKAQDPEGYVEFLKAEDEFRNPDPATMSEAHRAFDAERSKVYAEHSDKKSAAYTKMTDAKSTAYEEMTDAKAVATAELQARQLK